MMQITPSTPIAEEFILYDLEMVDAPEERAFDNISELASRLLGCPRAMITTVIKSQGLLFAKSSVTPGTAPSDAIRYFPLQISYCKRVQQTGTMLVIEDATHHPLRARQLAAGLHAPLSYLGVPVHLPNGRAIGAFFVCDDSPRKWTPDDLRTMEQLGECVDEQIALKQALKTTEEAETRASDAAAARESFLAHMSHEIRTPLNGIIGGVDLLMHGEGGDALPEAQAALVQTIDRSAQNLLRLLNDALDLSKIDSGRMELELAAFPLETFAEDIVALFTPNARAKDIGLELQMKGVEAGELRMGDAFRLRQVVNNILSNAIKFTDAGTVTLGIDAAPDQITISVADTGCGVAPEQLPRLFDPYSQAEASVARRKGGTGLGLAIVKNIVQLMAGDIRASSELGQGTTFTVTLPLPQCGTSRPRKKGETATSGSFAGIRVLIADDSPANRLILRQMLKRMGATISEATDGEEALVMASDGSYDLLLIDIQMPGMNGVEMIRALKAGKLADEGLKQGYCVAVTANVFAEQIELYLAAGFDACLAKPLRTGDLQRLLEKLPERQLVNG